MANTLLCPEDLENAPASVVIQTYCSFSLEQITWVEIYMLCSMLEIQLWLENIYRYR